MVNVWIVVAMTKLWFIQPYLGSNAIASFNRRVKDFKDAGSFKKITIAQDLHHIDLVLETLSDTIGHYQITYKVYWNPVSTQCFQINPTQNWLNLDSNIY